MTAATLADSYVSLITLREIRRYIVRSHAEMMAVFIGLVYGLISLSISGMFVLANLGGGYTSILLSSPGTGPGVIVEAPWGVLELPFFGVLSMILVSIGVALGMAVAVLLAVAVLRRRSEAPGSPASLGTLAGLTPAMIALLAFGACCSTSAAASAGVEAIAQVSGSTADALLLNNWYLSIFQLAIVWVALIAQEALLRVYGRLFERPSGPASTSGPVGAPRIDRRVVAGTAFRVLLLVAGVTWSLAMFADWTTVAPSAASPALWFDWIVVHQMVSALAVFVALFPSAAVTLVRGGFSDRLSQAVRLGAGVGGFLLVVGTPPPIAGWGIEGWGNELLALAGAPAAWGAVPPVFAPGIALAFRWVVQYLLLGSFILALAIRPAIAIRPLQWSSLDAEFSSETPRREPDASRLVSG
ncbi:MAG: hypothetical protein WBG19_02330 [Thermoplasmata archaeon]